MKTNGVNANTEAIAAGLWEILEDSGQLAPLAYGMIPAPLMEMTRKNLEEKLAVLMLAPAPQTLRATSGRIMRQVAADLLAIAKAKGVLIA